MCKILLTNREKPVLRKKFKNNGTITVEDKKKISKQNIKYANNFS